MLGSIAKVMLLLLFLAALSCASLNYLGWRWLGRTKTFYVFLLATGAAFTLYIREAVHDLRIPAPSDEANYVNILWELEANNKVPVSGPGYVYAMQFFHFLLPGSSFSSIVAVTAIILSCVYLAAVYQGYRRSIANEPHCMAAVFLLMTTSYFLWPMIEGRPQQLGMLMAFVGILLFYPCLKGRRYLLPFFVVLAVSFFYHILTFLVLSGTCLILWYFAYLTGASPLRRGVPLALTIVLGLVLFALDDFIYGPMSGGVEWSFMRTRISFLSNAYIFALLALGGFALAVPATWAIKRYGILARCESFVKRRANVLGIIAGILAVAALSVQFYLNYDVYMDKYHHNIPYFLLLSLGNVAFGALFIVGAASMLRGARTNIFLKAALAMMLLGAIVLPLSVLLPEGFNDWFIRIINYWTILAAPVAVRPLAWAGTKTKVAIMLAIPVLTLLSLINISRDPSLLGFP